MQGIQEGLVQHAPGINNNGVRVFHSLFTERPGITPYITDYIALNGKMK